MRFALSTHLFHDERLTETHVEAIAAAGWPAVEVFATRTHLDYHDFHAVAALRDWLSGRALAVAAVHAPIAESFANGRWGRAYSTAASDPTRRREAVDEARAALDAAVALACPIVVVHLGLPAGQKPRPEDNDAAAARRSAEEIAALADDRGLVAAFEVMPNAFSTPSALVDLFDGDLELGRAGICVDLGHAHMMDDVVDAIERTAGRLVTTHLHDNRGASDDHLVPFQGTLPWTDALTSLQKVGYGGALVFEVAGAGDANATLARAVGARRRLQAILEELSLPLEFGEA